MRFIKKFKIFESSLNDDTLLIFDFDDTLVHSHSFSKMSIDLLKENLTIEDLLRSSLSRIGASKKDLKWENDRIYIYDPNKNIKISGNWIRSGNRVYLLTPSEYSVLDISLPNRLKNDVIDLYRSVENKCIVTARPESIRNKIETVMKKLGLKMPKYGLHMAPDGIKNLGHWKGVKIVEILNKTGFEKAVFYDDNSKYLKKATKVVESDLPSIIWKTVKVVK